VSARDEEEAAANRPSAPPSRRPSTRPASSGPPSVAPPPLATPSIPPPFKYSKHVFLTVCALAFVGIVLAGRGVLLPFLLAILVGYVLFPAVCAVERRGMPRWTAILLVYAVAIGIATGFGIAVVPRLLAETKNLSAELPKLTHTIRDEWLPIVDDKLAEWTGQGEGSEPEAEPTPFVGPPRARPAPIEVTPRGDGGYDIRLRRDLQIHREDDSTWTLKPPGDKERPAFSSEVVFRDTFDRAIAYAQKNAGELLAIGRAIVSGVSRGIFYFFITLMLAGYLMFTYEGINEFVREMWPPYRRPSFDRFLYRLDRSLSGVVRGQLLICLVNGVLSAIGFWIFGLKYWPILSVIAAAMSIIPIFGSILSTVPAVAIGLTQSFATALWVLIWVVGIHQLEANFLNPKIIGDSAKIHPVLVVFALLLGEHLYQITGAVLAVPCLALVQAVFLHFRESVLGIPTSESMVPPAPSRRDYATASTTMDATPFELDLAAATGPSTGTRLTPAMQTKASAGQEEDESTEPTRKGMVPPSTSDEAVETPITLPADSSGKGGDRRKSVATTLKSPD
jgi:predicted PurR-regulated permease PerM